ncbi:MAG TPA: hypothetical protein VEC58_04410, partial [Roseiarcus sp.]|nr:hypothetical protein [Roseiarcus sp.]
MSDNAREVEIGSPIRSLNWRTVDLRAIAEPIAIASPLALIVSAQEPVMASVAILFLVHSWREGDWAWLGRGWFRAALALWLYALLRTLVLNPTATGALTALHEIHYSVYAAALAEWILPRPQARERLLWTTVATVTFYALDCLLQFAIGRDIIGRPWYHGGRLTSIFGKPGVGAELGWLYLPATIGLWRKGYPWLAGALGLASVTAVLLTGDRMGLLIALSAILLFAIAARPVRKTLLIALPAFAAVLAVVLYFNPAIYERQVATTAETIHRVDESVYGLVFITSLRVTRDHPLFGVGVRDYQAFCLED